MRAKYGIAATMLHFLLKRREPERLTSFIIKFVPRHQFINGVRFAQYKRVSNENHGRKTGNLRFI